MRKIIVVCISCLVAIGFFTSCHKKNYKCYATYTDTAGNVVAVEPMKCKMYFKDNAELVKYQQENNQACIEIQ